MFWGNCTGTFCSCKISSFNIIPQTGVPVFFKMPAQEVESPCFCCHPHNTQLIAQGKKTSEDGYQPLLQLPFQCCCMVHGITKKPWGTSLGYSSLPSVSFVMAAWEVVQTDQVKPSVEIKLSHSMLATACLQQALFWLWFCLWGHTAHTWVRRLLPNKILNPLQLGQRSLFGLRHPCLAFTLLMPISQLGALFHNTEGQCVLLYPA